LASVDDVDVSVSLFRLSCDTDDGRVLLGLLHNEPSMNSPVTICRRCRSRGTIGAICGL